MLFIKTMSITHRRINFQVWYTVERYYIVLKCCWHRNRLILILSEEVLPLMLGDNQLGYMYRRLEFTKYLLPMAYGSLIFHTLFTSFNYEHPVKSRILYIK